MNKSSVELGVGIFVLIGLICVGYLTIQLGKMKLLGDDHYFLNARFVSVSGLKAGAQVEIAGVQIGQVDSILLDPKDHTARVRLKIQKNIVLTDDVMCVYHERRPSSANAQSLPRCEEEKQCFFLGLLIQIVLAKWRSAWICTGSKTFWCCSKNAT